MISPQFSDITLNNTRESIWFMEIVEPVLIFCFFPEVLEISVNLPN
jgi:hypothetical protein